MTAPSSSRSSNGRVPLRLKMTKQPRKHPLDGGWWPQSRDLTAELGYHYPDFSDRVDPAIH